MAVISDWTVEQVLDDAMRRMMTVEHSPAGSVVTLPVTYPSGAAVVVEIKAQRNRCSVTDMAMGYQEAEFMGAEGEFVRHAQSVAADAGIAFDRHAFSVSDVDPERLPGAIGMVASCSLQAVSIAAMKSAETTED